MSELIVEFVRGTSEDEGRALAAEVGAPVRRRMRGDDDQHLLLLLKTDADRCAAVQRTLDAHQSVLRTEINARDFTLRS